MYIRNFIQIEHRESGQRYAENFLEGNFTVGGKFRGGIFEEKMNTYKMGLQYKRIYEISSKSNNGKVVKYTGKIFWGKISQGGGKFGGRISKKKMKTYKFPTKNEYMYEVS